jgi:CheY-like chemotaxis protein
MRHPTDLHNGKVVWGKVRVLVFGLDDQFRFLARQTFRKLNTRDITSYSVPADTPGLVGRGADIVLVDLGEQADQGMAVIERLRKPEDNPFADVPILVLAHPGQKSEVAAARLLGIEGVMPKPVSGHELTHRVADTLTNPGRLALSDPPAERRKSQFIRSPAAVPAAVPALATPAPAAALSAAPATLAAAPAATVSPGAGVRKRPAGGGGLAVAGVGGGATGRGGTFGDADIGSAPDGAGHVESGYVGSGPIESGPIGSGHPTARKLLTGLEPSTAARPAGGVPSPAKAAASPVAGIEPAAAKPHRRPRPEYRDEWREVLAETGHRPRTGEDVAALNIAAVVAEHIRWLQAKGAEGRRASFVGMDLAGADLSRTVLANATFREVDLSDALLAESRLDGADFRHATLQAADLAGANLGVANLRHAKLGLANLEGASLRGADLSGAVLTGARLAGADFKGAVLIGANLHETDLSEVENLASAQLEKSLLAMSTRLPPGVSRPRVKDED